MKPVFAILLFILPLTTLAQERDCSAEMIRHQIDSKNLAEARDVWVALPMNYDPSNSYPVLYVLDAEWRFDLVRALAWDLSGNRKIPGHIIVGIPHIEWEHQRGIDLTFSESRIEYDGEAVDSTWYNQSNSGGAENFYAYLEQEVIPIIGKHYATNGINTLIGHSYGGYFGAYVLSRQHSFSAFHLYDPSFWYSNGEATEQALKNTNADLKIFVTYQDEPEFHKNKITEFINRMENKADLEVRFFPNETHNSLFMESFLEGIRWQYLYWMPE